MEQYLSVAALAEKTQTSESYWRKAIGRGELPVVRVGGGRNVRVRTVDAERFIAGVRPLPSKSSPRGSLQTAPTAAHE